MIAAGGRRSDYFTRQCRGNGAARMAEAARGESKLDLEASAAEAMPVYANTTRRTKRPLAELPFGGFVLNGRRTDPMDGRSGARIRSVEPGVGWRGESEGWSEIWTESELNFGRNPGRVEVESR